MMFSIFIYKEILFYKCDLWFTYFYTSVKDQWDKKYDK